MQDELLKYYERELTYIRNMAKEFAQRYPGVASNLLIEADRCEDPHVERLLQGFAFIAARIRRKLDDEFPEIIESLMSVLYPHYLAPIPSMSVVQFKPDPAQGMLTDGYEIENHKTLYSQPIDGTPCKFRTCYPVTLWPLELQDARIGQPESVPDWPRDAEAVLALELKTLGDVNLSDLELNELRFYIKGQGQLPYQLYELIFNHVMRVELRPGRGVDAPQSVVLSNDSLRAVGFAEDEGLLPYPGRSFLGYRLLQEYFTFPQKFLFFDLCDVLRACSAGFSQEMHILLFLDEAPDFAHSVSQENFLLGCTPIVNLFEQTAEPINLDHIRSEYHLIPDLRRQPAMEVYSIDKVISTGANLEKQIEFQPLYSYSHAFGGELPEHFWSANRRPTERKDVTGTEMFISLVDANLDPSAIDTSKTESLVVRTTCTNRDLPAKLPFGAGQAKSDFEIDGAAPITEIKCLMKPTRSFRPPSGGGTLWRLISHLSLNYLSLVDNLDGTRSLQEILKLYDYQDSAATQKQISGITSVKSERVVRRVGFEHGGAVARGIRVTVEFDEERFVGSGVFLMAAVLERFLGLYVSINSFSEFVATTKQRNLAEKGPLKEWPARAGQQGLL